MTDIPFLLHYSQFRRSYTRYSTVPGYTRFTVMVYQSILNAKGINREFIQILNNYVLKLLLMAGCVVNIEEKTEENDYFREVLFTAPHSQLVVMSLLPNEEIGMEIHDVDQFLRVEEGVGKAILDGEEYEISDGSAIVVPAGVEHNIINTSSVKKLKLYTIYSPAHHKDKTIHKTKAEALADTEDHV